MPITRCALRDMSTYQSKIEEYPISLLGARKDYHRMSIELRLVTGSFRIYKVVGLFYTVRATQKVPQCLSSTLFANESDTGRWNCGQIYQVD